MMDFQLTLYSITQKKNSILSYFHILLEAPFFFFTFIAFECFLMQAAMNFDLLREDFSFFQTYDGDDDVEWVCE